MKVIKNIIDAPIWHIRSCAVHGSVQNEVQASKIIKVLNYNALLVYEVSHNTL